MIRGIALGVYSFFVVILQVLQGGGVFVDIQAPTEVTAGEEFIVNVEINKGDIKTFSRLQQSLPAGLTAVSEEASNSNFSFKQKKVRHIWMKMPEEQIVTLAYRVKVDERLKGEFSIDGKFSYIDANERRSVATESSLITILPSENIDPQYIVDIDDYERLIMPFTQIGSEEPQIACLRQKPQYDKAKDEFLVELLVSKERKERFAKIEESIPRGFRAEAVNSHDAIFTFKNNKAKFLWMNLPSSSLFTVSYRLVPDANQKKDPEIKGAFSYLEEDKTQSINIVQTEEVLASIGTRDELIALMNRISQQQLEVKTDDLLAEKNQPTETYRTPSGTKTEIKTTAKAVTKIANKITNIGNKKYQLEAESGIYYRVQIAAGHKPVNVKRYFDKYNLNMQVKIESHEGWLKYSLGSFPVYKEARDYRIFVWNTTEIDDAFVAAYNNGTRITVQEALMIADHKWYR